MIKVVQFVLTTVVVDAIIFGHLEQDRMIDNLTYYSNKGNNDLSY
jgi:hypothetical protein